MFLYHITSADEYVLDFILQYNSEENNDFEFNSYILCKNEGDIINKIKSRNYAKNKVMILLYENEDTMLKFISSTDFKYVFHTMNFKNLWDNINYFNKFVICNNILPRDVEDYSIIITSAVTDYRVEKHIHTISTIVSKMDLHLFFRNIIKTVIVTCVTKDKTMIMYVGNSTKHPQVYEAEQLSNNTISNSNVNTEIVKEPDTMTTNTNQLKLVNGVYKCNSSVHQKNINKNIINVCLIGDWIKSEDLKKLWVRYCKTGNEWNNLRLVDENCSDIDYYVIINRANFSKPVKIPSDKCLVFHMEPNVEFIPWYREFALYFNSNDLLFNGKHLYHKNNVDWHISKYHNEFDNLDIVKSKNNRISMVMSNRRDNIGHVMRLNLAHQLDKSNLGVDIYGKCDKEGFINYRKELPYYTRDEAIIPYKYHFMAENTSIDNYYTEKIIDCLLGETLCFYWGCPTLERFFDPRCFIRLPLHDTQLSLNIIMESIKNDEWSKRINFIRSAKYKLLNIYSLMPRVESILRLNINTNVLLLSHKEQTEVQKFAVNLIDQSFKNLMSKRIDMNGFNMKDLIEMCNMVIDQNQNMLVLQENNCYLADGRIDKVLYDKICDTLTVVYKEKLDTNILFLYGEKQDINNIFKMDVYITVDVAKILTEKINNNNYENILEFLTDIPLVRMKYIF